MKNQFVILAAGKGTRMGNFRVPKVLVMLKHKPLILYLLEEIQKVRQLVKPVVVVGYMHKKVQDILGDDYVYIYQEEQLGTAHALLTAKRKIRSENIVVVYGDMPFIKAASLKALIQSHFHSGANISLLTAQTANFTGIYKALEHSGRIIRDAAHNIAGIVEYIDAGSAQKNIREVNAGVYMFKTKWLWENLEMIKNKNSQREYYLTDIIDIAVSQGEKVRSAMVDPKEVIGVNSKEDLSIAELILNQKS